MVQRPILRNNKWSWLIILILCISAIAFMVYLGIRTNDEVQNIVQKQFTGQQLLLSRQISTGIENFLDEKTVNNEILAESLSDAASDEILSAFKNFYNRTGDIYVVEFVNESGVVTIGYPEENTPFGYDIYQQGNSRNKPISTDFESARKNKETYITNPLTLLEGGLGSFIWTPVYKDNEFKGMVLSIIKISDISDRFLKTHDSPEIYMIDNDGTILYDSSEKFKTGENYLRNLNDTNSLMRNILQEQINGAEGTGYFFEGNNSIEKLIAYSPVRWRGQKWSVAVISPESKVDDIIYSVYVKLVLFIGAAIGFILLGTFSIIILLSSWNKSLEFEVAKKTSELKNSNELLQNANRKLTELDKMKSYFVSMVSHELKTPLTAVKTSIEFLLEGDPDPCTRKEMLDLIIKNTDRLTSMVNDLLDLSRIESGRMRYRKEIVNLRYIIDAAVRNIKNEIEEKGLSLRINIPENLPEIRADRDKLIQVFLNLLSNAVKFTNKNGSIEIEAMELGKNIEVHVRDNGIGIPPDKLDKIFDKFYQVDNTSTRSYGGSGIGLAVAKGIVEGHGGTIRVESEPGRGSDFIVALNK
ncbi:MAG TPA: sensor histidine kinase [Candidatus Methanoperedens sp.]